MRVCYAQPMNIQRTLTPPPSGEETGDGIGYDADFLLWTEQQADALRARDLSRIDWDNLIEEVESLGKSQRKELTSRLTVILIHLLKYRFSIDTQPRAGWRSILLAQRDYLSALLKDNPSLVREVPEVIIRRYSSARLRALAELEVYEPGMIDRYRATLPEMPPYTAEQVTQMDWLPDPAPAAR